jgi:hypothetical protein
MPHWNQGLLMRHSILIAGWWACAGLLLTGSSSPLAANEPLPELEMRSVGEIVIAPDGRVASHQLEAGLAPVVQALVDKNVKTWTFEPILSEGRAVSARTRMQLALSAVPDRDGNYILKLDHVWFGLPKARNLHRPPSYPKAAIKAGIGARVLVQARLDDKGQVIDVHPYQTSLDRIVGTEGRTERWRRQFERASLAAVKRWQFTPGESIGGVTLESSVLVPLLFQIYGDGSVPARPDWRAYHPGPITPAPWVDPDSLAGLDTDRLGTGDIGALDSRVRLISDVIGKAL